MFKISAQDPGQKLVLEAAGQQWIIKRPADLETLWQSMDDAAGNAEDHIPYWVELWPATLALTHWLEDQDLAGKVCLDLGCGLGLSALVAAEQDALVMAMDHEVQALNFAADNARINQVPSPLWLCMDWNQPGFQPASFDYIWGGDIFYEQRFFPPLEKLLLRHLKADGRACFAIPQRSVSQNICSRFALCGWQVVHRQCEQVSVDQVSMTVDLWELRRP